MALGHDETDEYRKNLALLSDEITGSVGLFFTQLPHDQVEEFLLLLPRHIPYKPLRGRSASKSYIHGCTPLYCSLLHGV